MTSRQCYTVESIRKLKASDSFRIIVSSGDCYLIEVPEDLMEIDGKLFFTYPGRDKFGLIPVNQIVSIQAISEPKTFDRTLSD